MATQPTAAGGERDEERSVKVTVKVKFSQFAVFSHFKVITVKLITAAAC